MMIALPFFPSFLPSFPFFLSFFLEGIETSLVLHFLIETKKTEKPLFFLFSFFVKLSATDNTKKKEKKEKSMKRIQKSSAMEHLTPPPPTRSMVEKSAWRSSASCFS